MEVKCPTIALEKENDAVGSVLPGTTVTYTLTLTVQDGPAKDVTVIDTLPVGLEDPTDISDGGVYDDTEHTITWDLGDLPDGEYELTYEATVADDVENGEELVNAAAATSTNSQCPDLETLGEECEAGSTVIVRVPTLVIDKVADTEVITISGSNDDLEADPAVVTWTLTYTLTDGPVTNAVITDEIPVGFEFLDASDGGVLADGVVTWTFPTLTESGSVTFRTTVDPETISRVAPTVNVAVIDSDETEPDEGEDSVTVEVEPPVSGGNPTPKPSLPDTSAGIGLNGEPITVPLELLAAFFLGSLGALALANVKARSRRR
jgi:fimbrial isopeptide formation D2 family protein